MMETKKKFFMSCHLAGTMYHEADEVWDKLKVGTVLQLRRDWENRYDGDAVAVMYCDVKTDECYCIGYLPREDNSSVAALLEMGWTDILECRINRKNEDAHPEQQIHLTIKIKKRTD